MGVALIKQRDRRGRDGVVAGSFRASSNNAPFAARRGHVWTHVLDARVSQRFYPAVWKHDFESRWATTELAPLKCGERPRPEQSPFSAKRAIGARASAGPLFGKLRLHAQAQLLEERDHRLALWARITEDRADSSQEKPERSIGHSPNRHLTRGTGTAPMAPE